MNTILNISKKLSNLSYLLHFKGVFIPKSRSVTNVDVEKTMILIHSYINQQTEYLVKYDKTIQLEQLDNSFRPEKIGQILTITNESEYLSLIDKEISNLIVMYKELLNKLELSRNEYLYGLLTNQIKGMTAIYNKIIYDEENYKNNIVSYSTHPPRINEPFDSEAVLDDLF